jgi:hypothetical protein
MANYSITFHPKHNQHLQPTLLASKTAGLTALPMYDRTSCLEQIKLFTENHVENTPILQLFMIQIKTEIIYISY